MKKYTTIKLFIILLTALTLSPFVHLQAADDDGKLRIIVIGGHPDELFPFFGEQ